MSSFNKILIYFSLSFDLRQNWPEPQNESHLKEHFKLQNSKNIIFGCLLKDFIVLAVQKTNSFEIPLTQRLWDNKKNKSQMLCFYPIIYYLISNFHHILQLKLRVNRLQNTTINQMRKRVDKSQSNTSFGWSTSQWGDIHALTQSFTKSRQTEKFRLEIFQGVQNDGGFFPQFLADHLVGHHHRWHSSEDGGTNTIGCIFEN